MQGGRGVAHDVCFGLEAGGCLVGAAVVVEVVLYWCSGFDLHGCQWMLVVCCFAVLISVMSAEDRLPPPPPLKRRQETRLQAITGASNRF